MSAKIMIVGRGQPIEKSLAKAVQATALMGMGFADYLETAKRQEEYSVKAQQLDNLATERGLGRQNGMSELNANMWNTTYGQIRHSVHAQRQREREIFNKPRRKR